MTAPVDYEIHGAVALIALNNPPVNALGIAVREGVAAAIDKAEADDSIKCIVLAGRNRCFCGGADITEFGKPRKEPSLSVLLNRLEASDKPVVVAIHGTAVGGGCEISLGCHYRVGDKSARFGLPEINLGLLPGAGGTQRLPRLIGIAPALDIILGGEYVDAEKALELGFLDAIVPGDLIEGAIDFANGLIKDGKGPRRISDMTIKAEGAKETLDAYRKKIAKRSRGLIAPERCIEAVEAAMTLSVADGMKLERKNFDELVQSDQSKAQRHLFFAERQAHKLPGVDKDTQLRPIKKVAVIGCGTMGRGIAMSFASGGFPVTVLEQSHDALDNGMAATKKTYESSVKRGRITQDDMDACMGRFSGTVDYADLADADIVIEAVFEDMDLKKQVFSKVDEVCKPGAILATNTSSLDIDEIAAATSRPADVVGTHFFSPANIMKLMENVRGKATSPEVQATVMKLSKDIGKVGVMVGVCDGFVGNRMLYRYRSQAEFLLEEGALPEQIDKVIYDFGFPMGPFAMGDLAGLDVGYLVRKHRRENYPTNERYSSTIADRIVELGRHGQKNGMGWYKYAEGSRTPEPDPEIAKLIEGVSKEMGITRREVTDQEILERCMYTLINEGAKLLGEGIATRPSDIDLVWVHGYGYPIGRGGPMFFADLTGVDKIHETMKRLHDAHGELLRPAPLLEELATSGKSFADYQSK
ncbi:MAG: enoyl-CoA hydratase/isomerase family protein [Rhodospirillales bacterium]|nr:enoyl-CoA hydratase/isomerase family protein [Rhodospirillales bacterium]MBO6787031.1 enoyl-CoA hydratase/isomerase family protein [Rhodospirillales bacterium]